MDLLTGFRGGAQASGKKSKAVFRFCMHSQTQDPFENDEALTVFGEKQSVFGEQALQGNGAATTQFHSPVVTF
jgi:hypothetical protein